MQPSPKSKYQLLNNSLSSDAGQFLIIFVSHNAEDIRILCDEIFEIDNGEIVSVQSVRR